MYRKLTKVIKLEDGRECVTCVNYGTEECHIHKSGGNCSNCPMFAAILNQLYCFEEIITEK